MKSLLTSLILLLTLNVNAQEILGLDCVQKEGNEEISVSIKRDNLVRFPDNGQIGIVTPSMEVVAEITDIETGKVTDILSQRDFSYSFEDGIYNFEDFKNEKAYECRDDVRYISPRPTPFPTPMPPHNPPVKLKTYRGFLQSIYAIGAETSGYALMLDNGSMIEIARPSSRVRRLLDNNMGSYVVIKGRETIKYGAERGSYRVINVSKVLAAGLRIQPYNK